MQPTVGFHRVAVEDLHQLLPLLNRVSGDQAYSFWIRNARGLPLQLHPSATAAPIYAYDDQLQRITYGEDRLALEIARTGDTFAILPERRMIYIMPRRFDPMDPESLPPLFRRPFYRRLAVVDGHGSGVDLNAEG